MTIGGRKIQTRSLAVSSTNTNGLTPALVTVSHWLVDTFLFSDWQKPQIYFPIWLMFVSGRQPVWTLWQSRFLTWWNSTTLCSFPLNSILTFPWNPSCVQIYLLGRDTLSPALKSWSHLNILKKAKNCRQGSSFSGPGTRHSVARGLSECRPLIGHYCPHPGLWLVTTVPPGPLMSTAGWSPGERWAECRARPNMQISWPRASWPVPGTRAGPGCCRPLVYGNTDRGKTRGISIRSKSNTDGHWMEAPCSWTSSSGYLNDVNYQASLRQCWDSW